jgi:hypothetical protein
MALGSGGPNLLNEVLARLGITSEGKDSMKGQFWRILQFSSRLDEPFSRSETRAAQLRSNRCGAIRLNLKGRDPMGEVARGNDEATLI